MDRDPAISVVIPAYNAAASLQRAVESVRQQSLPAREIIVINDGSSDATEQVCQGLGADILYVAQPNAGAAAARNRGIQVASGEWIAFLDADDRWLPTRLELQAKLLREFPTLNWVAGRYFRCTGSVRKLSQGQFKPGPEGFFKLNALEALAQETSIWTGTVLVRKSVLDAVNGFDSRLTVSHDYDLWVRIALREPEIGFVNQPLAEYMVAQSSSLTAHAARKLESTHLLMFEKLAEYAELSTDLKVREYCNRILRIRIGRYLFNVLRTGNKREAKRLLSSLKQRGLPRPALRYSFPVYLPNVALATLRSIRHHWRSLR